jgi:hypothetical protein
MLAGLSLWQIPERHNFKRERFISDQVSEITDHDSPASLLCTCGEAEHYGSRGLW